MLVNPCHAASLQNSLSPQKTGCTGDPSAWANPRSFAINNVFVSLSVAKYQQRVNFSPLPESFAGISAQDGLTAPEIDSSR